mgnify:CR=1 FL=1
MFHVSIETSPPAHSKTYECVSASPTLVGDVTTFRTWKNFEITAHPSLIQKPAGKGAIRPLIDGFTIFGTWKNFGIFPSGANVKTCESWVRPLRS